MRGQFRQFLLRSIQCMDYQALATTRTRSYAPTGTPGPPHEVVYQNAWYVAACALLPTISISPGYTGGKSGASKRRETAKSKPNDAKSKGDDPDGKASAAGAKSGKEWQAGALDYWINGGLHWAVELLIEGDRMPDHEARFGKGGKYAAFDAAEYIILDFRFATKAKEARKHFLHVHFASDFKTANVISWDAPPITLQLLPTREQVVQKFESPAKFNPSGSTATAGGGP